MLLPTYQTNAARIALATRRAQLRTGLTINLSAWTALHAEWGPFPYPTIMWGMGDDGYPVILELNDPSAGAFFCISFDENRHALMVALLLSLAYLNTPDVVTALVVTNTPERWAWARDMGIPNLGGIIYPDMRRLGRMVINAYHDNRYLVIFSDGDQATAKLPLSLLRYGPANGIWPLAFCGPSTGLRLSTRSQPMRWTLIAGATSLNILPADLPLTGLQPGQWCTRVHGRVVQFAVPLL